MEQKISRGFGQYLRQLREERRLTLDQVEEQSIPHQPRLSKSYMSRLENGAKVPTIDRLSVLSKIYHTSLGHLVDRREIEVELEALPPIDVSGSTPEELRIRGIELAERGELKSALAHFRASEELAILKGSVSESEARGKARLSMAIALSRMGRYQLAKEEAERSIELMGQDSSDRYRAVLTLAMCHLRLGNSPLAWMLLQTIDARSADLSRRDQAGLFLLTGNIHLEFGRYREAAMSYRKAAGLYKALKNPLGQARALRNSAIGYAKMNSFPKAIDQGTRALEIARRADDKQEISRALQSLGEFHYRTGALKQARTLLYQSIELARRGDYFDTLFASYYYLWRMDVTAGDRKGVASIERALRTLLPKLDERLEEADEFRRVSSEKGGANV